MSALPRFVSQSTVLGLLALLCGPGVLLAQTSHNPNPLRPIPMPQASRSSAPVARRPPVGPRRATHRAVRPAQFQTPLPPSVGFTPRHEQYTVQDVEPGQPSEPTMPSEPLPPDLERSPPTESEPMPPMDAAPSQDSALPAPSTPELLSPETGRPMVGPGHLRYEGDIHYEMEPFGAHPAELGHHGYVDGFACGPYCHPLGTLPVIRNLEILAGIQTYTNGPNLGETASFGLMAGFNWAAPIPCFGCGQYGVQLGLRGTGSNESGSTFTNEGRGQLFATGGIFRRVDNGLQGGVVVDFLGDDWNESSTIAQLRGELSWMIHCRDEFGFWFTASTQQDSFSITHPFDATVLEGEFRAADLFAFYWRHHFCGGAEARFFAGFTDTSDGLIGGDLRVPISDRLALESSFTYLIPEESDSATGPASEAWNLGIGVVYYPGCRKARGKNYYRPLFRVADNGSLIIKRR